MTENEKINAILDFLKTDFKLCKTLILKNEAVKVQDFASALKYREEENQLRKEYLGLGEILLNSDQEVQASVATDDDSSKKAD